MADDAPTDLPTDAPPVDDSQQNGAPPADDQAAPEADNGGAPPPAGDAGEEVKLYVGNLDYGEFFSHEKSEGMGLILLDCRLHFICDDY
jgi:hypothetical protein